jgi:hypothetical protein
MKRTTRRRRRSPPPAGRPDIFCMRNCSTTNETEASALVVTARIAGQILAIRGQKVMIDADLAVLYDVPTVRLND